MKVSHWEVQKLFEPLAVQRENVLLKIQSKNVKLGLEMLGLGAFFG